MKYALVAVLALIAIAVALEIPELRRYMKVRRM
jgi:hypothetical protein